MAKQIVKLRKYEFDFCLLENGQTEDTITIKAEAENEGRALELAVDKLTGEGKSFFYSQIFRLITE